MNYRTSHQAISWFNQRRNDKTLILAPPFQRRPVWVTKQKQYLIDTILCDLPIPEIYIQRKTDVAGNLTYTVVDGQQRIRAILDFIDDKFSLPEDPNSEWSDCNFPELTNGLKQQFWNYSIIVRELEQATDLEVRDLFKRLNKYVFALTPQELRNARYDGPFIKLMTELADNEYWAENSIVSTAAIRRMADIQFISEIFIAMINGIQHKTKTLDKYYEIYEESFPDISLAKSRFIRTMELIKRMLQDIKQARWRNKSDYYSLFVVFSGYVGNYVFSDTKIDLLSKKLISFGQKVDDAVKKDGSSKVKDVASYAKAVMGGATDKERRLIRHEIIDNIIQEVISKKKK